MLTNKEAEVASALATQKALIDLGKHTAKLQFEKDLREKEFKKLKNYLLNIKNVKAFPIGIEYTKIDQTTELYVHLNELNKYVDAVNKFIKIIDAKEEEYVSNIKKLEIDIHEIRLENNTINLENENFENLIEKKEKYWSERVIKLREKCKQKNIDYEKLLNNTKFLMKFIYLIILLFSFFIIIATNRGLKKFIEDMNYVFYNTLNLVYFIYNFVIYIYQFFRTNYLFLSSTLFGLIGYKYLHIRRNFTLIGLILFINVGNSLYKIL